MKIKLPNSLLLITECLDGQERGNHGQCRDCAQGTYRTVGEQDNCTACPDGRTTVASKSISVIQCIVGKISQRRKRKKL